MNAAPLRAAFIGAAVGAILYCGIGALPSSDGDTLFSVKVLGGWGLTPLFAIPMAIGLAAARRMAWIGAIVLVAAATAAHYAAISAAIAAYDAWGPDGCVFGCEAGAQAAHDAADLRGRLLAGASGGATGALLTFLPLMALGPALRTRRALLSAFGGVAALALIGAGGLAIAIATDTTLVWALALYLPWQLACGAALALLFRAHAPKSHAPAP